MPYDLSLLPMEGPKMYKLLLCWRYLRTRYIALASIVSVMLGVATMIVVNSVMAGVSGKMRDRVPRNLARVSVEAYEPHGCYDPDTGMARGRSGGGDHGAGPAPP